VGSGVEYNKDRSITWWGSTKGGGSDKESTSVHRVYANRTSKNRNLAQKLYYKLLEESHRAKRMRDINAAEQQRFEKIAETSVDFISQNDNKSVIHKLLGTK